MISFGNTGRLLANSTRLALRPDSLRLASNTLSGAALRSAYQQFARPRALTFTHGEIAGARQQATSSLRSLSQSLAADRGSKPSSTRPAETHPGHDFAHAMFGGISDQVRAAAAWLDEPRTAKPESARPNATVGTSPKPGAAGTVQRSSGQPMSDAAAREVLGIAPGKALKFDRIDWAFTGKSGENAKTVPLAKREARAAELQKAKDVLTRSAEQQFQTAYSAASKTLLMEPGQSVRANQVNRQYDVMCDSLPKSGDNKALIAKFTEARNILLERAI